MEGGGCSPAEGQSPHGQDVLPAATTARQEPPLGDPSASLSRSCSRGPSPANAQHEAGDPEGGSFGCGSFGLRGVGGWEREPLPLRVAEGQLPVSPLLPALGQGAQAALRGPGCEYCGERRRSARQKKGMWSKLLFVLEFQVVL